MTFQVGRDNANSKETATLVLKVNIRRCAYKVVIVGVRAKHIPHSKSNLFSRVLCQQISKTVAHGIGPSMKLNWFPWCMRDSQVTVKRNSYSMWKVEELEPRQRKPWQKALDWSYEACRSHGS